MSKIRFIKPTINISAGTIADYQPQYARALVAVGVAEYYTPKAEQVDQAQAIEKELVAFAREFNKESKTPVNSVEPPETIAKEEKPKRGRPTRK